MSYDSTSLPLSWVFLPFKYGRVPRQSFIISSRRLSLQWSPRLPHPPRISHSSSRFPPELKLQIITCVHDSRLPNVALLRRTHFSFLQIIPKSDVRAKSGPNLSNRLREAESTWPFFLPQHHYTCCTCLNVLRRLRFRDNEKRQGKYLGGRVHFRRICLKCGANEKRYGKWQSVPVGRVHRKPCGMCGHFLLAFEGPVESMRNMACSVHVEYLRDIRWADVVKQTEVLEAEGMEEEARELFEWWQLKGCYWEDWEGEDSWSSGGDACIQLLVK